jgi:integrase
MTITTARTDQPEPLFLNPAATTLADVITRLPTLEPDERRQRELASGMRTVARVLSTPVEALPADPSYLGRLVRSALPARHGVSATRWSNALSLLRRAMTLAGCQVMAGRRNHPLSPAWQALTAQLPRYERAQLSRLTGYLSARGIGPEAITAAIFDDYREALEQDSLLTNPRDRYQRAVVAWTRARATVSGWSQVEAPALPGREAYVRPLSNFLASFQEDAQRWLDRLADPGLSEDSPLKPVRPATLEKWAFAIRQMASALVLQGISITALRSLADLLRDGRDERIVTFFFKRGDGRCHQAHGVVARLTALARYHPAFAAKEGQDTDRTRETLLLRLRRMGCKVAPETRGMTAKNRQALKPFEDEHRRRQLVNLPARIFDELPRRGRPSYGLAVRLQTALAVAILLSVPMRARNLARLAFGDNLLLRDGTWWVEIPGEEVKNGQAIEMPLAARTGRLLEVYREQVLPVLTRATSRWVFPGQDGAHKAEITQAQQIKSLMTRELGCPLSPHQFRHLVGYLYLLRHPSGHEVVRIMLGHRSIDTTIRFYAGMEGLAAARQYDAMLQELRDEPMADRGVVPRRSPSPAHGPALVRRRGTRS